ncbi:methyltransferase [Pseudomonas aeruginosa]
MSRAPSATWCCSTARSSTPPRRPPREALLSGTPGFELAFGEDFYSYPKRCPDAGRRFPLAMKASNLAFHEIPRLLDFRGRSFVDVGGGSGELTKAILAGRAQRPGRDARPRGFLGVARDNLSSLLAGERVSLVGGDMLQEVPSNGDIYLAVADHRRSGRSRQPEVARQLPRGDGRRRPGGGDRATISASEPSPMSVLWDVPPVMACAGRHRTTEEVVDLLSAAASRWSGSSTCRWKPA